MKKLSLRPASLAEAPCSAVPITAQRLAVALAREIFAIGDEPTSPCTRIQFKGGHWPDNERNQGGIGEPPLAQFLEKKLLEWGCPPNEKLSD